MNLGERIREVRLSKGIKQRFVAKALGKTPQWLNNIEQGRRPIGAVELHRIAEVLGVEVGVFFGPGLTETENEQAATLDPTGTEGR
ncbi:MAG: helix-turn-helix domain-containing protein [Betaproteobacteria bacterium]